MIEKSNYKKLIQIFNVSFNFKIPFEDWSKSEFIEFAKDFMSGNTEYYQDEYFINNYQKVVNDLLTNLESEVIV